MTQMTWRRDTTGDVVHPQPPPIALQGVEVHRGQVVRRLLTGGISARTLRRILPEWTLLIDEAVAELAPHRPAPEGSAQLPQTPLQPGPASPGSVLGRGGRERGVLADDDQRTLGPRDPGVDEVAPQHRAL